MKEANGGYLCKKKWCKKLNLFLNIYLKKITTQAQQHLGAFNE